MPSIESFSSPLWTMATLSELQETGPAGDFYAWVLKRYQRLIVRLVVLLVVVAIGSMVTGFWLAARLTALEQEGPARVPAVEGPTMEQWQKSVAEQTQRDAALQRKMTKTTNCLNGNLISLNKALQQLVLGRLGPNDFVTDFKLRACR